MCSSSFDGGDGGDGGDDGGVVMACGRRQLPAAGTKADDALVLTLSIWRCAYHEMHPKQHRDESCKHLAPSELREEFDDRNRLHSIETLLINSAHFPRSGTRSVALDEMNEYLRD